MRCFSLCNLFFSIIKLLTRFNYTNSAPAPVVEEKKESPAPAAAPAAPEPSTGGALGSVQGQASGGKKLEAETVSAETLSFLKNYQ